MFTILLSGLTRPLLRPNVLAAGVEDLDGMESIKERLSSMYGCCRSLRLEAGDSSLYGEPSTSDEWYRLCSLSLRDEILWGVTGLKSRYYDCLYTH